MIGIYGGTFNPIHQGHLRAAEEVLQALGLDRMIFIPSARPPHKRESEDDVIAPAKLRLQWVELAIGDHPHFEADPIEVARPGPSFLLDTLLALRERYSGSDEALVFTVGQDAFVEMGSWRSPERLFELTHIAVTTRPPVAAGSIAQWLPECVRDDIEVAKDGMSARHRRSGSWIRQVPITALDISASDIRSRLRANRSVRYLVPPAVLAAIEASQCYTPGPRTEDSRSCGESGAGRREESHR